MKTRLALLRHGRTAWNRDHRLQGRTDIPLDDAAREELSGLKLPEPWDTAVLWSSPLSRAVQTAQILTGRAPKTNPALIEMNWGAWEGQKGMDLKADRTSGFRDIEDWGWAFCPPEGEPPSSVRERIDPWLQKLAGTNLAVCHIGVMRVILAQAYGWNFKGPCPFSVKRNRLYILNRSETGWTPESVPLRLGGTQS